MTDAVLFWTLAVIVTGFVLLALLPPLLGRSGRASNRAESARTLYGNQLRQVDEDLAKQRISAAEADAARTEIGRRMLHADDDAQDGSGLQQPKARSRRGRGWAAAVVLAAPIAAVGLYLNVGQPDLPDQPLSGRKDVADAAQAQANAEQLVSEMTAAVQLDRNDLRSWVMLARGLSMLERLDEAADAYTNALALAPDEADLRAAYGEILVRRADGQVTDQAVAAFQATLDQVPDDPRARYYMALRQFQEGDLRTALADWRALAADSPPNAGWMASVQQRIAEIEQTLGPAGVMIADAEPASPALEEEAEADAAPERTELATADDQAGAGRGLAEPGSAPAADQGLSAGVTDGGAMPAPPPPAASTAPSSAVPIPSESQVADMMQLSPEDRQAQIAGMVDGLAARLQQNPDDVDGWLMLARSYVTLGDLASARLALANASDYGPNRIDAQLAYARLILEGQPIDAPVPPEAIEAFNRVIVQDPTHPDALWFLGLAAAQQRDFGTARDRWTQLLDRLDPESEAYVDVQSYIAALSGGATTGDSAADADDPPVSSSNATEAPAGE